MQRFIAIFAVLVYLCPLFASSDIAAIVASRQEAREAERQAMIRWMENQPTLTRDMDDYDVRYYKIDLDLDFDDEYITAEVTVRVEVVAAMDTLQLHFADLLTVDGVTMGAQTLAYTHSNGILSIDLGQSYSPGELVQVLIAYSGYPDQNRLEDGLCFEEHAGTPIAFTMVSPMGARKWWPCKDTPADKPDYIDVWVRHPSQYTCVSNGMLQGVVDHGDGTVTTMYLEDHPIATYLTSFACTNYELHEFTWDYETISMPVENYYYAEQEQASIALYSQCGDMLTFFSDMYGMYPFCAEKYGHATCTALGAYAMEHQTCTSFNASYINDDAAEYTVAHELSHSWAGDCVSISDWSEVWLKEGFAVYSEAMWAENQLGEQALFDYMDAEDTGSALDEALYRDPSQGASHIFNSVVYNKGGWVLHMLRFTMGDDAFFAFLHDYFTDPDLMYGNTDMQILEDHAEAAYGDELDWFFDQWFYQEGRPRYDYAIYARAGQQPIVAILASSNSGEEFSSFLPYTYNDFTGRVFVEGGMNHVPLDVTSLQYDIEWDADGWILDGGFTEKKPLLEEVPTRDSAVGLVWEPYFDEEIDGFQIFRSENGGDFEVIGFAEVDETSYRDTGLDPESIYSYAIRPLYVDDVEYYGPLSNTITTSPVEYTLDEGVLVVDNSADYTTPGFPTDEEMDAFYARVTEPWHPDVWDVTTQGEPPLSEMARYSTIVWHADDILVGSITDNYYNLKNYLMAGGNMLISQSRKLSQVDTETLESTLGIVEMSYCQTGDFAGAFSEEWPSMTVDPDKVPLPTWGDYLANVYQFDQALGVVISLRFDSASDDPEWENKPCGLAGGGGYHLVLLGFPLYYLVEEEVAAFIEHYMYVYGETAVQGESAPAPQLTLSVAPNPFNPVTTLSFSLDAPSDAVIGIYDVRGRRVLHEKLDHLSAGDHTWTWDAGAAASGVYLLRLEAGGQSVTRRAVLLK